MMGAAPAGILAAAAGWLLLPKHPDTAAPAGSASAGSPQQQQQQHAGDPMPTPKRELDMSNPLNRWLPETDCDYCLDTREKL